MEGTAEVNGVNLWYRITGEGEPVVQIHGAGFGHFNFDPATPELSKHFRVIDYDMRGYGQSDRPFRTTTWRCGRTTSPAYGCAGDRPGAHPRNLDGRDDRDRLRRQVPGTHDLGRDQLRRREARRHRPPHFQELDRHRALDPDGPGSRILAELITWQALSKAFLEEQGAEGLMTTIQPILRDSNRIEVFCAACQAMCDMDITEWLPRITSPALVLGGDEDLMTPWDQGPGGVGQEGIYTGIAGAEKHVILGSGHSTIFDNDRGAQPRRDRLLPPHTVDTSSVRCPPSRSSASSRFRRELHTTGWRDLFAINFTFFLNPVMYVLGAFAVVAGGLPLWWAVARDGHGSGARIRNVARGRAAGRRLRAAGARSRCVRTSASGERACFVSVPGHRRDLLVRRASVDRRARDPGDLRGDDR